MVKKKSLVISIISLLIILVFVIIFLLNSNTVKGISSIIAKSNGANIDAWEYSAVAMCDDATSSMGGKSSGNRKGSVSSIISSVSTGNAMDSSISSSVGRSYSSSENYIGYTVGGASNIDSFRQNIKNKYLPITTDITYNGIYSEYYFDTGDVDRSSNEMFYPSYSMAVSTNPLTGEKEYFMSVGLNSNIKESDFVRPKINVTIVLDISGSMSSSLDSYYYDGNYSRSREYKSKMKVAEECVNNLIDKLNPDDRLGIVLFDDCAYVGQKIITISEVNKEKLKDHILEVEPRGGTNFSAGYNKATEFFEEYLNEEEYQNRIIVVTDAMPNLGETSSDGLYKSIKRNADKKIYTSFIGVGVDFNTELTEKMSDVRGANYYSVHSADEFNTILAENFDYMITPLIYDLDLNFDSEDYEIENVYGSDSVNTSTGNIMHVNTLFPSASNEDGEVKGGIIVLKLKKIKEKSNAKVTLNVSYTDTKGEKHSAKQNVKFKASSDDYYDNLGIRKAIVLARYVNLMKYWIVYERTKSEEFNVGACEYVYPDDYVEKKLGVNERVSKSLEVSESYKSQFKTMKSYIQSEMNVLNDKDLKNEIDILNELI